MKNYQTANCTGNYNELLVCDGPFCLDGGQDVSKEEATKFINQAKGNLEVYLVTTECKPIENHIAKVKGYASENMGLLVGAVVVSVAMIGAAKIIK